MSRTDKDVPYNVHVARIGREEHDHRFGFCDFEPTSQMWDGHWSHWNRRQTCGLAIRGRYYYAILPYFPRTKRVDIYRKVDQAQDRRAQKEHARNALKLYRAGDVDGIDELPDPPINHRRNALWLAW